MSSSLYKEVIRDISQNSADENFLQNKIATTELYCIRNEMFFNVFALQTQKNIIVLYVYNAQRVLQKRVNLNVNISDSFDQLSLNKSGNLLLLYNYQTLYAINLKCIENIQTNLEKEVDLQLKQIFFAPLNVQLHSVKFGPSLLPDRCCVITDDNVLRMYRLIVSKDSCDVECKLEIKECVEETASPPPTHQGERVNKSSSKKSKSLSFKRELGETIIDFDFGQSFRGTENGDHFDDDDNKNVVDDDDDCTIISFNCFVLFQSGSVVKLRFAGKLCSLWSNAGEIGEERKDVAFRCKQVHHCALRMAPDDPASNNYSDQFCSLLCVSWKRAPISASALLHPSSRQSQQQQQKSKPTKQTDEIVETERHLSMPIELVVLANTHGQILHCIHLNCPISSSNNDNDSNDSGEEEFVRELSNQLYVYEQIDLIAAAAASEAAANKNSLPSSSSVRLIPANQHTAAALPASDISLPIYICCHDFGVHFMSVRWFPRLRSLLWSLNNAENKSMQTMEIEQLLDQSDLQCNFTSTQNLIGFDLMRSTASPTTTTTTTAAAVKTAMNATNQMPAMRYNIHGVLFQSAAIACSPPSSLSANELVLFFTETDVNTRKSCGKVETVALLSEFFYPTLPASTSPLSRKSGGEKAKATKPAAITSKETALRAKSRASEMAILQIMQSKPDFPKRLATTSCETSSDEKSAEQIRISDQIRLISQAAKNFEIRLININKMQKIVNVERTHLEKSIHVHEREHIERVQSRLDRFMQAHQRLANRINQLSKHSVQIHQRLNAIRYSITNNTDKKLSEKEVTLTKELENIESGISKIKCGRLERIQNKLKCIQEAKLSEKENSTINEYDSRGTPNSQLNQTHLNTAKEILEDHDSSINELLQKIDQINM